MSLRNILKPSREKILLDLLLSVVWFILVFTIPWFGFDKILSSLDTQSKILVAALNLLVFLVIFYPLSCGLVALYRMASGKDSKSRKDQVIALLLVLVFNPLTFSLVIMGYNQLNTKVLNEPCGIEVTGFPEQSPAKAAGMNSGEVIVSIDGQTVDTTESLTNFLRGKKAGDTVSVKTDKGVYDIVLIDRVDQQMPAAGIFIKQKYCKK